MIQTTFVNGVNPFPHFEIQRKPLNVSRVVMSGKPVRSIYSLICERPGVTVGDLIKETGNTAASKYCRLLEESGEVKAIKKRTKPGHQAAGVRHYYPSSMQ